MENNKESVPFAHYAAKFRELEPEEAAHRLPGVVFTDSEFHLTLLGRRFGFSHPELSVRALDGGALPGLTVQTFLLRYLLEGREYPWLGNWKTFRELPWGETYASAFSGRVLGRAAFTFGSRIGAFRTACEKMGAAPVPNGDAGYEFDVIGNCKMRLLIWEGDEEFPPSAQILYSDNFGPTFTAEDRVVAGDLLIAAIKEHMA